MRWQQSAPQKILLQASCWLLFLTSCITAPTLSTQISDAEQKWLARNITSYQITVLHIQSIWHAQTNTITVRDGKVVDQKAKCIRAASEREACEAKPFEAEGFTVPGLFEIARARTEIEDGKWTKIEFDPNYGYPSIITYDNPNANDDDVRWSVEAFQVQ